MVLLGWLLPVVIFSSGADVLTILWRAVQVFLRGHYQFQVSKLMGIPTISFQNLLAFYFQTESFFASRSSCDSSLSCRSKNLLGK